MKFLDNKLFRSEKLRSSNFVSFTSNSIEQINCCKFTVGVTKTYKKHNRYIHQIKEVMRIPQ